MNFRFFHGPKKPLKQLFSRHTLGLFFEQGRIYACHGESGKKHEFVMDDGPSDDVDACLDYALKKLQPLYRSWPSPRVVVCLDPKKGLIGAGKRRGFHLYQVDPPRIAFLGSGLGRGKRVVGFVSPSRLQLALFFEADFCEWRQVALDGKGKLIATIQREIQAFQASFGDEAPATVFDQIKSRRNRSEFEETLKKHWALDWRSSVLIWDFEGPVYQKEWRMVFHRNYRESVENGLQELTRWFHRQQIKTFLVRQS